MLEAHVKHAAALFKYPEGVSAIGEKLRKLRIHHKLNLEEVASAVGISASALSQIETGQTKNPKPQHFVKLCAFYSENENRLLFDDPDPAELKKIRGLAAILGNRPRSRSRG